MVYESQEILKQLQRIDATLQRGAYTEQEIHKAINDMQEFNQLLRNIRYYTSALEKTDPNDVNTMLELISDLDATLASYIHQIETVQEYIRMFLNQFSDDEIRD